VRVGEPDRVREPDVGDAVNGAQLREILDLDAARPMFTRVLSNRGVSAYPNTW